MGEWRGRGRGRGGREGRGGGSSNPHNHSYARKDGQQQNDQQQSSQHAGSVVCFNCNGNGHKAYQCPTKREEERGQARQENFNKRRGFGCISSSLCLVAREHKTQLIEGVDESQDTPDNQDASVEEAPQVEALEEEIERAPGGRNEEGTEVLDVADAEPVHVVTPDHANKNQEVDEVPNVAPPISIHDSHNYQR
ncbi:hypothetical protein DAPPUDRAFT_121072 [Daphnia pulex]|uniref:CCHC-type domain-containing protein n=1 Tax=Daphnia pulex TaxID=6669 RepID=E9I2P0_DAPPU|nr:hypothetical protein DAPPUDRAFT_121072 [Daphnia pulex]|eukprot:EFX61739.1 hypothetical protein DAPPUDRAFT_121072 [Daphnia pulex]